MVLGQSGWRGEVEDNWKVEGDGGQVWKHCSLKSC